MSSENGLTPLGEALKTYLARSGLDDDLEAASVVPEWDVRVGDRIAKVTRPIRVSDGVLVVAVRSSAWLMELKMMERPILQRLNEGKRGPIRGIRFVMDEAAGSGDSR